VHVRSALAQAYLSRHGWKALPPDQPNLLPFAAPPGDDNAPVVQVPVLEQARDYPQRVIEFLSDLAVAEDRYAVEVLNDILQQGSIGPAAANGPGSSAHIEPATK
jgi:hypothetical protein